MTAFVVVEKSAAVIEAERVVRLYLGDDAGLVSGKPWDGDAHQLGEVLAWRSDGYDCPYCWVSRGTLKGAAAHLLFWHRAVKP